MDCLDGLKQLDDESVDVAITSPPYNLGRGYGDQCDDNMSESEYKQFTLNWVKEVYRVLKQSGRLYIIVSDKLLFTYRKITEKVNFNFVQVLVWCKPNLIGGTGRVILDWRPMTEFILLVIKGKRNKMRKTTIHGFSFFVISSPQSNWKGERKRYHPTQFPVKLIEHILTRTPGKIILDPFIGSGTTAVVCKKLGLNFIGFELNPDYVKISKQRLSKIFQSYSPQENWFK